MNPTEVAQRFHKANRALRETDMSQYLVGAQGDPEFKAMKPEDIEELMRQDNQAAQQAQAEVRAAATRAQTVNQNDISSQEGQQGFTQENPSEPLPMAAQTASQVGPFSKPNPTGVRRALPGESIVGADEVQFLKPTLASVPSLQEREAPNGMQAARDVSALNQQRRVSSIQVPREMTQSTVAPPSNRPYPGTARYGEAPRLASPPVRVDPDPVQEFEVPTQEEVTSPPSIDQMQEDMSRVSGYQDSGEITEIPDLQQIVVDIAKHLGKAEAAHYFGTTQNIVSKWIEGVSKPTIQHLQIVLSDPQWRHDPIIRSGVSILMKCNVEEGDYVFTTEKPRTGVMLGCAILGNISPAVAASWMALVKRYDLNYVFKAETLLVRARNLIVDQFLETDNEYLLMVDADVILPFGNPGWYKSVTQWKSLKEMAFAMDTIPRLLSWRKEIVAGVYAGRALGMPMINQSDLNPKSGGDKEAADRIRKGIAHGLLEQDWVPTGCMMIHRKVFDAIRKRFPNLAPRSKGSPWGWFNMEHDMGEDVSFCLRARQSGYKCYLDQELVLAHIGKFAFGLEHTGPVRVQSM